MRTDTSISRRTFLAVAGTLPFAASSLAAFLKDVPVGLELYSVRDGAPEGSEGHGHRGRQGRLPGRRVLRAVSRLDAGRGEGRPEAARRPRHQVPLDAQQRSVVHGRRAEEGDRAESDHRQQVHHHGQRREGDRAWTDGRRSAIDSPTVADTLRPLGMATGYHNHQPEWQAGRGQAADGRARREHAEGRRAAVRRRHVRRSPAPTPSRGSTRTPDASAASTARTGARVRAAATPSRSAKATCRGRRSSTRPKSAGGVEYYLIEQEESPDQLADGAALPRELEEAARVILTRSR